MAFTLKDQRHTHEVDVRRWMISSFRPPTTLHSCEPLAPDNYEDVIEYPRPLPDAVSEILNGNKRQDGTSDQED